MKFILIFLIFVTQLYARPIISDLSLRSIEIDSGFLGTEILLFGARNDPGDIVILVRGPKETYIVRKKEKIAGIWVNNEQEKFSDIYGFYAASSNKNLENIKNEKLLRDLGVGIKNLEWINSGEFSHALLNKKTKENLFSDIKIDVSFIGQTLFRSIIRFPENISRGTYSVEVYLFSDGNLVGFQSMPLEVKKTGFDALIYNLAYEHSLIYGILSVLIALAAGWLAGILFKRG